MAARMRPSPEALPRMAAALVHAHLAGRAFPDSAASSPRIVAARLAPEFLETLASIHGVRRWTPRAFRRVVLVGAFGAWRPGSLVLDRPSGVEVISPACPLGAEVERDARACLTCRAFQEEVARAALPGLVEDVRFEDLISRGDGTCRFVLRLRRAPQR